MTRTIDQRVELLLSDPEALANHCRQTWEQMPRAEIDALQLAGLQRRFAELRERIPVLKKLADGEGVERIEQLDDLVPLLFEHTVFKSYPPSLLEKNNFTAINKWLAKLVTPEVGEAILAADVSACKGLDDWFETMDREVPQLIISHTSGTSGTLSFLPCSAREFEKAAQVRRLFAWNMRGPQTPQPEMHTAYPYYSKGYLSHLRGVTAITRVLLPDASHFHPAYPSTLSSDVLHLGAKLRAAHAKGTLDRLVVAPEMLAKKEAFDRQQAEMPQHLATFFEDIATRLKGKRVYIGGTWNLLHNMAKAGLERGLEGVFDRESYIITTGGAKGVVQPEGWREEVMRFTGVKALYESYAMSEVVSGSHLRCEHGHYHFAHTAIPCLLDPETSKPLPRKGRQTGRAAFFDLGADVHWGGFITGDEVTVEWDAPCACGRPSRYVVGAIQRYSEKNGGDDKITCAASEQSHREAMDFLNTLEG
ncbi:phenylacetate--CoA ligase [Pseudomonas denitrificans (nom. rej.)]|uniref:Phenylacetate--CoA ligase n=1 Tax=Pseudomonas denitrificans TaxID=43306 RepID=A0A9X7R3R9_PSEDE|nr:phenylacetate--CoA ligase [Pseudomonas denitrificans (nom. rej.)]QEY71736.1 phenylacetate--CoA ligase [Pseudomonas denitrificans (nom. rej.)]